MITLSSYEEQQIYQKLPPQLAALKSKYPSAVYNAASAQHLLPLAPGIKPKLINIYYGEEDNDTYLPNISLKDGKLDFLYLTEECVNNPVIQIEADSNWIYIEVEQQILLDRLGDLEAANYFGLAPNDSGGSWWALDRYFNFYVTPAQHFYVGAWSTSPKSDLPNLKFEGTLGYYYPYQAYNTCTFSYFINCIPNCNELQCPPPPGLRPLYSLTYFGDTDTGKRHYLLTTNKAERDHLLVTEAYKWQCSIGTASERIPTTLNESACVLGFVY